MNSLLWLVCALGAAVLAVLAARSGQLPDDLAVYRGATTTWLGGGDLYAFHRANGDGFTYPPAAGLVLLATALLPIPVLAAGWVVSTAAACAWCAVRLGRAGSVPSAVAFAFLLFAAPGRSNLGFGQVSVFVFALTLVDACAPPRMLRRGVLTGVAAAIKLTPLPFVLMFAVRREWADLRRCLVAGGVTTAVGALIAPGATDAYLRTGVSAVSVVTNWSSTGNQSIRAALARGGVAGHWWLLLAALVMTGALRWTARRRHQALEVRDWAIVGCATILACPVSWTHHRFWVVVALLLPGVWALGWRRWLRVALLCATALGPIGDSDLIVVAVTLLALASWRPPACSAPAVDRERLTVWRQ
ncbi:glycosyltransferase 87 family protein [Branchiibius sp. NY16-3462-2]|uniref:glycosyltransferase 87 family protein n=1 Tax=Branchiibius sp. NY16-3462-2 TaxID=1807500 RepID=UPI00079ACF81|nr:glycosyltransferase 87 family protein [Branchiibius sp. NY16-3462-2]KYH45975.1 hypothetical protein AZH51_09950 [Branchiibius sp. NY16-3462-2]